MNNLPTIDVLNDKYVCCYDEPIIYDNLESGKHYIVELINHNDEDLNRYFVIKIIDFNNEILVSQSKYRFTSSSIWIEDRNYDDICTKLKSFIVANTKFYKYVLDHSDDSDD
jgi:hypothetical protein